MYSKFNFSWSFAKTTRSLAYSKKPLYVRQELGKRRNGKKREKKVGRKLKVGKERSE